jgi:hypothetical protein
VNEPSAVVRSMTYHNGVLDTGVALVKLEQSGVNEKKEERKEASKRRIEGISVLRNFTFVNETTVLARKAFGIGNGIEINISSMKSKKSLPKLEILEDFSDFGVRRSDAPNTVRTAQQENVQPRERELSEESEQLLYDCDRCSKSFVKQQAFEVHMNGEKHESQPMKTSADLQQLISQYWIGQYGQFRNEKKLRRQSAIQSLSVRNVVDPAELDDTRMMMGFALQKTTGRKVFNEKQHTFMKKQTDKGLWADPTVVAQKMATCGEFERHEQLKPQQIKSYYSAMKYRMRYKERKLQPITEEELIDSAAEEAEMTIESERERFAEALSSNEDLETAVLEHPVSFAGEQLCDSRLEKKTIRELQAIAKYLRIRVSLSTTKKNDLAWRIFKRLNQCECECIDNTNENKCQHSDILGKQQAREIAESKAAESGAAPAEPKAAESGAAPAESKSMPQQQPAPCKNFFHNKVSNSPKHIHTVWSKHGHKHRQTWCTQILSSPPHKFLTLRGTPCILLKN